MPEDGGRLVSDDFERIVRDYYLSPSPFGDGHPRVRLTRRQRLRIKWSRLRWRVGHRIAGHDCDDDA